MGKVAQNSVKYVVKANLKSKGIVEKPDVVGAIFGQTEGLLGEDLDLRELQERGKVGRIDVKVREKDGSSKAMIKIPSSLDSTETALLAASLETIERVGPTNAEIKVNEIEDQRNTKRDYIVKRAKQLLQDMQNSQPGKEKITEEIKQEVRTTEITEYKGFKAGPEASESEEIIFVEGKADVLNLMKHGVKNAVALGGTSLPKDIDKVSEGKTLTVFLDGDRGGELILKEVKDKLDIQYVAKAPHKKEVEELGKEQVFEALRDKKPVKYTDTDVEKEKIKVEDLEEFQNQMEDLIGTRAVYVLNNDLEVERRFPVESFDYEIEQVDSGHAILFDGEIDNEKVEKAEKETRCSYLIGMEISGQASSSNLRLFTKDDLEDNLKLKN